MRARYTTKITVRRTYHASSYELEHAPRRANQARETKAMYDEYVHARGSIQCWFESGGEKLGTHAVALPIAGVLKG